MLVEEFEFVCASCGAVFTAAATVHGYGLLLLQSGSGCLALLNANSDPAWADAERLLRDVRTYLDLPDHRRGNVFQQGVVPLLYDPDEAGFPWEVEAPPPCPKCGHHTMADWRALDPPRLREHDLPAPTANAWFELSEDERRRRLREAVVDVISR